MQTRTHTRMLLRLSAIGCLLVPSVKAADTFKIDPAHTSISFSVRHMGVSNVKGHFDEFSGTLVLGNGAIKDANGTIQTKSVDTGIQQRDNHLRSPEIFDAAKYPLITFKTKSVEQSGDQTVLIGDFTMHGVTRELRLPVTLSGPIKDPQGNTRLGLEGSTTLNRKDYGMKFNGVMATGGLLVGDEIKLEINAEAVKQSAEAADS